MSLVSMSTDYEVQNSIASHLNRMIGRTASYDVDSAITVDLWDALHIALEDSIAVAMQRAISETSRDFE